MKTKTLALLIMLAATIATVSTAATPADATAVGQTRSHIAHRPKTDNCNYFMFGIGTYSDWSELEVSISFCSPSGQVNNCYVQPDCNNGQNLPAVVIGPGEGTINFFGFSPWSGFAPCEAITHANSFVCPTSLLSSPPSQPPTYTYDPATGIDIQSP